MRSKFLGISYGSKQNKISKGNRYKWWELVIAEKGRKREREKINHHGGNEWSNNK